MARTTEDRTISKCYSIRSSNIELLAAEVRRRGLGGERVTDSALVNEALQIAFGGGHVAAQPAHVPSHAVPTQRRPPPAQNASQTPPQRSTLPAVNLDGNNGLPPGMSEEAYKEIAFRPDRSETERLENLERSRRAAEAALFAEPVELYERAKRTGASEDWEAAYQCAKTIHGSVRASIMAAKYGQPGFEMPKAPTLEENLRLREQFYKDNPGAFTAEDVLAKIREQQARDAREEAKNVKTFEMRDNAVEGEHPEVATRKYDPEEFKSKADY